MAHYTMDKCKLSALEQIPNYEILEMLSDHETKIMIKNCLVTFLPETKQIIITSKDKEDL